MCLEFILVQHLIIPVYCSGYGYICAFHSKVHLVDFAFFQFFVFLIDRGRRTQAASMIADEIDYIHTGTITLRDGENVWQFTPAEFGLFVDAQATAEEAYRVGRKGFPLTRWLRQFQSWNMGTPVAPQILFDQRIAQIKLEQIAAHINQPTVEASLTLDGFNVRSTPGQIGREINIPETLSLLQAQLLNFENIDVTLSINEQPPQILDASIQAQQAADLLSQPLVLQIPNADESDLGPWTFKQETLANMVTIEKTQNEQGYSYQVGLDRNELRSLFPILRFPHRSWAAHPQHFAARCSPNPRSCRLWLSRISRSGCVQEH